MCENMVILAATYALPLEVLVALQHKRQYFVLARLLFFAMDSERTEGVWDTRAASDAAGCSLSSQRLATLRRVHRTADGDLAQTHRKKQI